MSDYANVSFEKALVQLRKDVLVLGAMELLKLSGEFMGLYSRASAVQDLKRKEELSILLCVCNAELKKRGLED